jgi:hypothetical protein
MNAQNSGDGHRVLAFQAPFNNAPWWGNHLPKFDHIHCSQSSSSGSVAYVRCTFIMLDRFGGIAAGPNAFDVTLDKSPEGPWLVGAFGCPVDGTPSKCRGWTFG